MPSGVAATCTVSIVARISAPIASSVMPSSSSMPRCPSAVAPPWLPIAGTTNGSAPRSRRPSMVPRRTSTRPVSPRLPAPTATVMPGDTSKASRSAIAARAALAMSPTPGGVGMLSATSWSSGTTMPGWNGRSMPLDSCSHGFAEATSRAYNRVGRRGAWRPRRAAVPFAGVTPKLPAHATGPAPVGGSYTFGGRKGRMSASRQRALDELVPEYLVDLPITDDRRLVVEIGCGKGDATAAMAPKELDAVVVACEVNGATIAHLATLLDAADIENVRLWHGDALQLLAELGPASVAEVRMWFPDPWPKPRHAHKRLVTPERLAVVRGALVVGGRLRLATDDMCYAEQALAAIVDEPRLCGEIVSRPADRPVTAFEARAKREG